MRNFARLSCLFFGLLAQSANANVIYDWVTTSYSGGDTSPLSDLYSVTASWTLADAAVERGGIQLVGYGAHPEEIIDFSLTARSLDGSRSYSFDKFDTGIDFALSDPWNGAYHQNLRLFNDSPVADISVTSLDSLAKFYLYSSVDIGVLLDDGNMYGINGHWTRRQIPEPSSMALFALGLAGIVVGARRYRRRR